MQNEKMHRHFETIALHGAQDPEPITGASVPPLFRTASYVFRDTEHASRLFALEEPGHIYTRISNPSQEVLENRMAMLEGGAAALAVASGTSAVFYAVVNILQQGDEIVSSSNIYGGTYTMFSEILPKFGINTVFVDPSDPGNFVEAIHAQTKAVFVESLGNPALDMVDLQAVADIAHGNGIPLIVDSTFTTPYLLRPL
jgi:O-acetylhomoserine (thiol)-lyase